MQIKFFEIFKSGIVAHKNTIKRGKLKNQGESLFSSTMRFGSVRIPKLRYLPASVVHWYEQFTVPTTFLYLGIQLYYYVVHQRVAIKGEARCDL